MEVKWIASLSDGARHNPMGHRSPEMKRGSFLPLWRMPETSAKHETESGLGQREGCHGYLRILNKGLLVSHLHPVPLSTAVKLPLCYRGVHGVFQPTRCFSTLLEAKRGHVSTPGPMGICRKWRAELYEGTGVSFQFAL